MGSISVPTRLPRATSLGAMEGITDVTRPNRMDRLTRLLILGEIDKMEKMVKPTGAQKTVKC